MSNPIPGVNPIIEASGRWVGFHNLLIARCSELLNAVLPPQYAAFVEERLELIKNPEPPRSRRPDLSVAQSEYADVSSGAVAFRSHIEPAVLTLPDLEEVPEAYIDIRSLPEQQIVTSVEILSPSNKSPAGRGEYWAKRAALLRQAVHLVEIDLLLGGRRLEVVEPLPPGDFFGRQPR